MARTIDRTGPKYLTYAGAVIGSVPLTLSCWFYPLNDTQDMTLLGLSDFTSNHLMAVMFMGEYAGSEVGSLADRVVFWFKDAGAGVSAYSGSAGVANKWQHVCGTSASTTDRKVYLNGTVGTNNTSSKTPTVNRTAIGVRWASGSINSVQTASANIAECAIWNVSLDASEAASLAAGVCPLFIRPSALVAYWPLVGQHNPESDIVGRYNMTPTNNPVAAAHPRMYYPTGQQISHKVPAAATFKSAWTRNSNVLISPGVF